MNKGRRPSSGSGQQSIEDFERFYRTHYDAVSRYVARRVDFDVHDSVVAATFVVAWRKFDVVPHPSLPWLYRIASFEVAQERRRSSRFPQATDLSDLELTDTHPLEDVIDISIALSQLSDSDAELIRLVHWEQLSRVEVAGVLGCSVNAVNVRYHRAIQRLSSTVRRVNHLASDRGGTMISPEESP